MAMYECPSCALTLDRDENPDECPYCGYEFPTPNKSMYWVAWLFATLLLIWPVFRLLNILLG